MSEAVILPFPGSSPRPSNDTTSIAVTSLLTNISSAISAGTIPTTSGSSATVVISTPGQTPWMGWTITGGTCPGDLAQVLLDGVRGSNNGDDPNEVAAEAWLRREARKANHAKLNPWVAECCGARFRSRATAEKHEAAKHC